MLMILALKLFKQLLPLVSLKFSGVILSFDWGVNSKNVKTYLPIILIYIGNYKQRSIIYLASIKGRGLLISFVKIPHTNVHLVYDLLGRLVSLLGNKRYIVQI